MQDIEALKKEAGIKACEYVQNGMKVGLGTGSTVKYTIIELARRIIEEGLEITGVPTSLATKELAESLGISLIELDQTNGLDIVIDGADEFDPSFQLIKEVELRYLERKSLHKQVIRWWLSQMIENK